MKSASMRRASKRGSLRLFYSYCHSDSRHRRSLEEHLSLLKRDRVIEDWYDGLIGAGAEVDGAIDSNLARSDIVLLLISSAFLHSDYCWKREMTRALKRHKRGIARVIPIIVRPIEDGWQNTVFGQLKALPKDGKAVTKWPNRDAAWANVANGIREAARELTAMLRARKGLRR